MIFKPSPKQVLALWNMLFTGQEPAISKIQPGLNPGERRQLQEAGLIEIEKRGRANHIILTEKAWAWAASNLKADISSSKFAGIALRGLLSRLQRHLDQKTFTLAGLLAVDDEPVLPDREPEPDGLAEQIRAAYLRASGGGSNVRVRLKDLRRYLPGVPKPGLDAELIRLQQEGIFGLVLWSLDDPLDIGPEDEAGAVEIGGVKRHIVYMEVRP
ncbi:MAG: hypothetical protein SV487_03135 [Thermodesulfobacteriota bacterium]|nr:hypothetical protein [Thermodesulfobacteriota bacterium]